MGFFRRYKRPMTRRDLLVATAISLALWAFAALAVVLLSSCGPEPKVEILPPNTSTACERAIECKVFLEQQRGACEACLEHVDPVMLEQLVQSLPGGELPPIDEVTCEQMTYVAGGPETIDQTPLGRKKNGTIRNCVVGMLYGPITILGAAK